MGIKDFLKFGNYVDGIKTLDLCIDHFFREKGRLPTLAFDMSVLFHHFIKDYEARLVFEIMNSKEYGTEKKITTATLKGYLRELQDYLDGRQYKHAYLVFDGPGIPYKEGTMEKRRESRVAAYDNDHFECAVETPVEHASVVQQFIDEEFTSKSITKPWTIVMAPCEADAELYALQRDGLVDIIVTVDSDVIAYGSKRVFLTRPPRYFIKNDIEEHPNEYTIPNEIVLNDLPSDIMLFLAWFLGNDYTNGITGIGQKTIPKLIAGMKFDLSKGPLDVARQFIEQFKVIDEKRNNVGKTATKQKKDVIDVWNEIPMLFKIFKTYPVISVLLKRYETLSRVQINTLNECKYTWKTIEPIDAFKGYDIATVNKIPMTEIENTMEEEPIVEKVDVVPKNKKNDDEKAPKKNDNKISGRLHMEMELKKIFEREELLFAGLNDITEQKTKWCGKRYGSSSLGFTKDSLKVAKKVVTQ